MQSLITVTTSKSIFDAATALRVAVEENEFGVMHVYNLKETMAKKGVEFGRDCQIFEICQPEQAKRVLNIDMSVSTALPCRISLHRDGEKTTMATIKPTVLMGIFDTPQMLQVAGEIEETIAKIMNEAASS